MGAKELRNVDKVAVSFANAADLTDTSVGIIRGATDRGDLPKHYPTSHPRVYVDDLRVWFKNLPKDPPKK